MVLQREFRVPAATLTRTWRGARPFRRGVQAALAWLAGGLVGFAAAQGMPDRGDGAGMGPHQAGVTEWLVRLQQASRVPSFVGTFVVTATGGSMGSARIWHVWDGKVPLERVETLSGQPRDTFRRSDAIVTFLPDAQVVKYDKGEVGGVFPNLLSAGHGLDTAEHYVAREIGHERVAGFEADIVELRARDPWRYGYRVWSEKRTGLVVKTQTLDAAGRVLEQAAFSELQLNAPVSAEKLRKMMADTRGYHVVKISRGRTSAEAEGWQLRAPVPGFAPQNCYRRVLSGADGVVQWLFSDGLATVSLFMEPFDAQRHVHEGVTANGATHTLTQRLTAAGGEWWVTAVGEVPTATLSAFVQRLERRR